MKHHLRTPGILFLTPSLALGLCVVTAWLTEIVVEAASVKYVSVWSNPLGGVVDLSAEKVAAFVVSADQGTRLGPEETLASELRSRGLDCIAGYTVLPGEMVKDVDKAKEFIQRAGITSAVMMRVAEEERTRVTGGTWYSASYYPSFWGYWDYGWSIAYSPTRVTTDRVFAIETLVYSIERDRLLWAGKTEAVNPTDVRKLAKQLVNNLGRQMRKAGLVKK